jgi:peptidoglycan/xylan/chitin deacetylase (PgdA/CDA1 family)
MDSVCSTITPYAKVRTWFLATSLAVLLSFIVGCARPVEERTARERSLIDVHRAKLNLAKEETKDPLWQTARAEVDKGAEGLPTRLGRLIRGPHNAKALLLTFDDGPHASTTLPLLKVLAEEHVPATFFVIGKMAEKRPDLVRAIARAGHTLANHTFSHVTLPNFPLEDQRTEYRANNELIERITGQRMAFCRPPGGDYNSDTLRAAEEEGLTTVLWTDDPGDFANPGDGIVLDRTLKKLSNGGIILLHDGSRNTLDVLRELIHEARERGFEFTTPQAMVDGMRPMPSRVAMRSRHSVD